MFPGASLIPPALCVCPQRAWPWNPSRSTGRWNSRCPFQHRQTRLVMNVPAHTRLLIASSYKQMTAGHHVKELNPNGPEQMIQRPVTTGWMVMVPSVAGDVNRHFTHHFPCNSALTLLLIGLVALNLGRYEVAREKGGEEACACSCVCEMLNTQRWNN